MNTGLPIHLKKPESTSCADAGVPEYRKKVEKRLLFGAYWYGNNKKSAAAGGEKLNAN